MTGPFLLVLALLGLLGGVIWRHLVRDRQVPLALEDTNPRGVGLFVLGWILMQVAIVAAFARLSPEQFDEVPLSDRMLVQGLGNIVAVGIVLLIAQRMPGGVASFGLRRPEESRPLLAGFSAWLTFLPLLAAVMIINQIVLDVLGVDEPTQDHVKRLLAEPGSPIAWIAMIIVIPPCEELLFRGALQGGLRRHMPPVAAIVVSGLLFGIMHDPVALLPVSALGMLLAWLYERTGSLAAPSLAHAIHNGVIVLLASLDPESLS